MTTRVPMTQMEPRIEGMTQETEEERRNRWVSFFERERYRQYVMLMRSRQFAEIVELLRKWYRDVDPYKPPVQLPEPENVCTTSSVDDDDQTISHCSNSFSSQISMVTACSLSTANSAESRADAGKHLEDRKTKWILCLVVLLLVLLVISIIVGVVLHVAMDTAQIRSSTNRVNSTYQNTIQDPHLYNVVNSLHSKTITTDKITGRPLVKQPDSGDFGLTTVAAQPAVGATMIKATPTSSAEVTTKLTNTTTFTKPTSSTTKLNGVFGTQSTKLHSNNTLTQSSSATLNSTVSHSVPIHSTQLDTQVRTNTQQPTQSKIRNGKQEPFNRTRSDRWTNVTVKSLPTLSPTSSGQRIQFEASNKPGVPSTAQSPISNKSNVATHTSISSNRQSNSQRNNPRRPLTTTQRTVTAKAISTVGTKSQQPRVTNRSDSNMAKSVNKIVSPTPISLQGSSVQVPLTIPQPTSSTTLQHNLSPTPFSPPISTTVDKAPPITETDSPSPETSTQAITNIFEHIVNTLNTNEEANLQGGTPRDPTQATSDTTPNKKEIHHPPTSAKSIRATIEPETQNGIERTTTEDNATNSPPGVEELSRGEFTNNDNFLSIIDQLTFNASDANENLTEEILTQLNSSINLNQENLQDVIKSMVHNFMSVSPSPLPNGSHTTADRGSRLMLTLGKVNQTTDVKPTTLFLLSQLFLPNNSTISQKTSLKSSSARTTKADTSIPKPSASTTSSLTNSRTNRTSGRAQPTLMTYLETTLTSSKTTGPAVVLRKPTNRVTTKRVPTRKTVSNIASRQDGELKHRPTSRPFSPKIADPLSTLYASGSPDGGDSFGGAPGDMVGGMMIDYDSLIRDLPPPEILPNVIATRVAATPPTLTTRSPPRTPRPPRVQLITQDVVAEIGMSVSSSLKVGCTAKDAWGWTYMAISRYEGDSSYTLEFLGGVEKRDEWPFIPIDSRMSDFALHRDEDMVNLVLETKYAMCEDKGRYLCEVNVNRTFFNKTFNVDVKKKPEKPQLKFPDDIFAGQTIWITTTWDAGNPVIGHIVHDVVSGFTGLPDAAKNEQTISWYKKCAIMIENKYAVTPDLSWNGTEIVARIEPEATATQFEAMFVERIKIDRKTMIVLDGKMCSGKVGQSLAHPYSEQKFISCRGDGPRVELCPEFHNFNATTKACVLVAVQPETS